MDFIDKQRYISSEELANVIVCIPFE